MVKKNVNKKNKASRRIQRKSRKNSTAGFNVKGPSNSGITTAVRKVGTIPRAVRNTSRMSMVQKVCSITDPFCPGAKGMKYPDGQGGNTLAMQLRGHYSPLTDATGNVFISIHAALWNNLIVTNTLSSGNYIGSATGAPYASTTQSYSSTFVVGNQPVFLGNYRVVSAGVILRNLLSANTAQGYCIVQKRSTPLLGAAFTYPSGDMNGTEVETFSLAAGAEMCMVFKPQGTESRVFQAPVPSNQAALTSVLPNTGWDYITIDAQGCPVSSSPIDVEYVYNIEFTIVNTQDALAQLIPKEAPSNPKMIAASTHVVSTAGSLFKDTASNIGSKMEKYAANALDDLVSEGFALLGL